MRPNLKCKEREREKDGEKERVNESGEGRRERGEWTGVSSIKHDCHNSVRTFSALMCE